MANELSVYSSVSYTKDTASFNLAGSKQITVNTNIFIDAVVNVPTTDITIDLGSVSSVGYVYVQNLDTTNFVLLGSASGNYFIKLLAGEVCLFRSNVSELHMVANTTTCAVQYAVVSN